VAKTGPPANPEWLPATSAVPIFRISPAVLSLQPLYVASSGIGVGVEQSQGRYVIKRAVQEIKALARQYASGIGDTAFLRNIQRAMSREETTVAKRRAAMAGRAISP
jgi:hypothetical protein